MDKGAREEMKTQAAGDDGRLGRIKFLRKTIGELEGKVTEEKLAIAAGRQSPVASIDFLAEAYRQILQSRVDCERNRENIEKLTTIAEALKKELHDPPKGSYLYYVKQWVESRQKEDTETAKRKKP